MKNLYSLVVFSLLFSQSGLAQIENKEKKQGIYGLEESVIRARIGDTIGFEWSKY